MGVSSEMRVSLELARELNGLKQSEALFRDFVFLQQVVRSPVQNLQQSNFPSVR